MPALTFNRRPFPKPRTRSPKPRAARDQAAFLLRSEPLRHALLRQIRFLADFERLRRSFGLRRKTGFIAEFRRFTNTSIAGAALPAVVMFARFTPLRTTQRSRPSPIASLLACAATARMRARFACSPRSTSILPRDAPCATTPARGMTSNGMSISTPARMRWATSPRRSNIEGGGHDFPANNCKPRRDCGPRKSYFSTPPRRRSNGPYCPATSKIFGEAPTRCAK